MTKLPQPYEEMISAKAPLRDFRVALIGELDKIEWHLPADPLPLSNELELRLGEVGLTLFEEDDGVIDFKTETDINLVKGSLCTNFSKEKFAFAERMIREQAAPKSGSRKPPVTRSAQSPIEGLSDLRAKAESGEIPPRELKRNLKVAILRELDADQRRESPIAETVAEEAEKKLALAGERLYEDDDGAVEFCSVGRPSVTEDTLDLVKGALATNFSREKLHYASTLQSEFRRRGYDRYQVKRRRQEQPRHGSDVRGNAQQPDSRNQQRASGGSRSASGSHTARQTHSVNSSAKWILAAAAAAVLVVVSLIVTALKK